jgi:hypothetical protein
MVLKYSFEYLNSTTNPIWGVMLEVNNATSGLLGYSLLAVVFVVSAFVFMRRTQDISKSLLSSLHITTILCLLLFYAGKTTGYVFIGEVLFYALLVIEAVAIALVYFNRSTM